MAEQLFKKNCDRDISLYLFTSLASVTCDQKTWSEFNSTVHTFCKYYVTIGIDGIRTSGYICCLFTIL